MKVFPYILQVAAEVFQCFLPYEGSFQRLATLALLYWNSVSVTLPVTEFLREIFAKQKTGILPKT